MKQKKIDVGVFDAVFFQNIFYKRRDAFYREIKYFGTVHIKVVRRDGRGGFGELQIVFRLGKTGAVCFQNQVFGAFAVGAE